MEYIKRLAENVIKKQEKMFKTILVTGARQVGKTTMLKNIKSDVISVVMNRLDTNDKKNDFLSFMIDNRNVLISLKDIFSELNLIAK